MRRCGLSPRRVGSVFLLGALLLLPACSGAGLNDVSGKVIYKGAGIKGATVVLHPKSPKSELTVVRPEGVTGEDGTFTLTTGGKAGAPAGEYTATISWMQLPETKGSSKIMSTEQPQPVDKFEGRYADRSKSKFNVTISGGKTVLEPFNLD